VEKNKRFVNEYEYNSDFVKEAITAWWNTKFKKSLITMCTLMIILIVIFLITMKIKWLLISLICLLPIILLSLKKKIAIKTELERMDVVYKGEPLFIKVIFDNNIRLSTSQGERSVELNAIESFVETKNLIVLMVKGSMTIAFSKAGFTEGTCEEFLQKIKQFVKKHNKFY